MPDQFLLESLVVENFRSIRGRVVLPMNAPVVLIHGPNGTGKSSVMTALALALAGKHLAGLPDLEHLVHHGAESASIGIGSSEGPRTLNISPTDTEVGAGVLDESSAAFFVERCYLEQTKLTRLLDLYQDPRKGAAESALTRFVKELLRLDELDALADGLHISGDVRRVEGELPIFKAWRADLPALKASVESLRVTHGRALESVAELERSLTSALAVMGADDVVLDDAGFKKALEHRGELARLARLETLALRLEGLARRREELAAEPSGLSAAQAEEGLDGARQDQERWWREHGHALDAVVTDLQSVLPRLPSPSTVSPNEVFEQAFEGLDGELKRLRDVLNNDDALAVEHRLVQESVRDAEARLEVLDRELADETSPGEFGELARVLADLATHIAGYTCPVCGRDYSEISEEPLSAHVAAEIARLSARAGQLQSAARARLETTRDLQRQKELAARLVAQRLERERREKEERELERLTELAARLEGHEEGARRGGAVMREVVAAEGRLSEASGRDRVRVEWSEEFHQLEAMVMVEVGIAGEVQDVSDLSLPLSQEIELLRDRQVNRDTVLELWTQLGERRSVARRLENEKLREEEKHAARQGAVEGVQQRMENARVLLRQAERLRRATISRVFNSTLNAVWADLFVRLAPDEEYVPAFTEQPESGPLTTRLETRRRDGTPGGSPNDMLSAGNLNTAALTLFLALHLSARPRVPWLLLDDPVQSMDEIHVAQFAALLRTLTQQDPQRKIVLAVHERALFDYLTLELSPASPTGGLVTVELRRERGGDSTALPKQHSYVPDTALSAA